MAINWDAVLSNERLRQSRTETDDEGHEAMSDYYRVVFSSPFRRLQDKTQVTPLAKNDYVRRRLTHSVEVATVGERMARVAARRLELGPEKIFQVGKTVATACLLHDIGNPPFGHQGERVIRKWVKGKCQDILSPFLHERAQAPDGIVSVSRSSILDAILSDYIQFNGNPHGFRIATRLSNHGAPFGMNLTMATLAATVKEPVHSKLPTLRPDKFACMLDDEYVFNQVWARVGLSHGSRHPLVWLVEAADDIVNRLVDIEDALKMNYLSYLEVREVLMDSLSSSDLPSGQYSDLLRLVEGFDANAAADAKHSWYLRIRVGLTTRFVRKCQDVFVTAFGTGEDGLTGNEPLIDRTELKQLYYAIKDKEYEVFKKEEIVWVEAGASHALETLLNRVYDAIRWDEPLGDLLPTCPIDGGGWDGLSREQRLMESVCRVLDGMEIGGTSNANEGGPPRESALDALRLESRFVEECLKERRLIQRTVDYVAGMTDSFAVEQFRRLVGIAL